MIEPHEIIEIEEALEREDLWRMQFEEKMLIHIRRCEAGFDTVEQCMEAITILFNEYIGGDSS